MFNDYPQGVNVMKYIVYKTTNLINNYIYIGVHKTATPYSFDYYLANGIYVNNPSTYEHPKTKMQQAVKEFGVKNFRRETLTVFDNAEDASDLEAEIVNEEFLLRDDVYNMVLGGYHDNLSGIKVFQYDENGNYMTEYNSYEEAAKTLGMQGSSIRRAVMYKYRANNFYFNTDKLDKIDISLYNTNLKIKVYRYLKTGEFDKEFESYNDAARNSDSSPSNIRSATLTGYCVKDQYYFSFIKEERYDKARSIQIRTRPVHKYDSEGNYIESYDSQEEAEKANPFSNITKSIKLKSVDENGFMWSLEKLEAYNKPKRKGRKKVGMFDNNGVLLKTWDSARQCGREVGTAVQNVLNGKYKKHKGFIYKYLE